jgi:hypothetical protein
MWPPVITPYDPPTFTISAVSSITKLYTVTAARTATVETTVENKPAGRYA